MSARLCGREIAGGARIGKKNDSFAFHFVQKNEKKRLKRKREGKKGRETSFVSFVHRVGMRRSNRFFGSWTILLVKEGGGAKSINVGEIFATRNSRCPLWMRTDSSKNRQSL